MNIVFNSKDIKFFFSLKQLEYEVGFKFSTEIKYLLSFVGYSISDSLTLRNVVKVHVFIH